MGQSTRDSIGFWSCVGLTFVVAMTCVRIEYLNVQAGGYLPRTDFGGGNQKWRFAAKAAIRNDVERRFIIERLNGLCQLRGEKITREEEEEALAPRFNSSELAEIQARVEAEIARQEPLRNLHDWVATMGLLQYFLAPLAFGLALWIVYSSRARLRRVAGLLLAAIAAVSIGFMVYREYYSSLGW